MYLLLHTLCRNIRNVDKESVTNAAIGSFHAKDTWRQKLHRKQLKKVRRNQRHGTNVPNLHGKLRRRAGQTDSGIELQQQAHLPRGVPDPVGREERHMSALQGENSREEGGEEELKVFKKYKATNIWLLKII